MGRIDSAAVSARLSALCSLILVELNSKYMFASYGFLLGILYLFSLLFHVWKNGLKGHYSSKLWDRKREMAVNL